MAGLSMNAPLAAVVAAAAIAGSLWFAEAQSRGLAAHATVAGTGAQDEIKLLRLQLTALTARVTELEKKADDVKKQRRR